MPAISIPWWGQLEKRIFTRLKTKLNTALGSVFTDLFCTSSPMSKAASKFPTVYFRMIDWSETGNDLQNTDTNAVWATAQIDVISNTSKDDCETVIYQTINIMKSMRFSLIGMPTYTTSNNLYTGIVRFRRVIGQGDTI